MLHQHQEYWQKVQDTLPSEITIMNKVKICKNCKKTFMMWTKTETDLAVVAGINL